MITKFIYIFISLNSERYADDNKVHLHFYSLNSERYADDNKSPFKS